jgi:Uma2 family endonuclease
MARRAILSPMPAAATPSVPEEVLEGLPEQRMLIPSVTWKDYVVLREVLDTPGLRMTYCKGALELMSPSRTHELYKTSIARLVELYAVLRELPLVGYGSTTFRNEARERGAEPDECYRVGTLMKDGEVPDIVLEVIQTNPLLDKLVVYEGLDVPEVWLFRHGAFEVYHRGDGGYQQVERSRFLPDLDMALIAQLAQREDQHAALMELRDNLLGSG